MRRCCKRSPFESCCGATAFPLTTTTVTPGTATTLPPGVTTSSLPGNTTTTLPQAPSCSAGTDCGGEGFSCCNLTKGLCCRQQDSSPENVQACQGSAEAIFGPSASCTRGPNPGPPPPTPEVCGPDRPTVCPPEAEFPVYYQCYTCGDGGKVGEFLYNTQTGTTVPYR